MVCLLPKECKKAYLSLKSSVTENVHCLHLPLFEKAKACAKFNVDMGKFFFFEDFPLTWEFPSKCSSRLQVLTV